MTNLAWLSRTRDIGRLYELLPFRLRALVRSRESGLVAVAAAIGVASALCVAAMGSFVQLLHQALFGIGAAERLSTMVNLVWWRALIVPVLGGLILAFLTVGLAKRFKWRLADAIEANALYGGRLSLRGSLLITVQTLVSTGFGASVGLEAGYTQICSAVGSWIGQKLAARRADIRILVAAGAAGAIAAAFESPLAGAFYGFEVVLGTYSVGAFAPVAVSALSSSLIASKLMGHAGLVRSSLVGTLHATGLVHVVLIALLASGASILLMRGVAFAERTFATSPIPARLRPALGGLVVGGLALITPQVLSAGHGALSLDIGAKMSVAALAGLLALKSLASIVSLGAGFRGGLFFATLLLGSLLGHLYADVAADLGPAWTIDPVVASLAGMSAFGTGVVGAPLTMTFITLDASAALWITVAAFVASIIASLVVREMFGFSFATWRFHLRGETIRGPQDVGWVRELTVAKLMRPDVRTMRADVTIKKARKLFPLGSTKQVALESEDQRYVGLVSVVDLHTSEEVNGEAVDGFAGQRDTVLFPWMNIAEALEVFRASEADALVVLDGPATRKIVGLVSEAHALRRYGEELDRRNKEMVSR